MGTRKGNEAFNKKSFQIWAAVDVNKYGSNDHFHSTRAPQLMR